MGGYNDIVYNCQHVQEQKQIKIEKRTDKMNEIQVNANIVKGSINFDHLATRKKLQDILIEYREINFDNEDSIKFAKGTLAELREAKLMFDKRRKEIKAEWNKPYQEFEEQAKDIINLFDTPINKISAQVKQIEEKKQLLKYKELLQFYEETVTEDVKDYVRFESIFNEKWYNVTYAITKIKKEITDKITNTQTEIKSLKAMESIAIDKALSIYKANNDFMQAVKIITDYEEVKRQEEAVKKEEQIINVKKEAVDNYKNIENIKAQAVAEIFEIKEQKADAEIKDKLYSITATDEEMEQIEMYMNSIGVEFQCMTIEF
jgi:hypothetical protein